MVQVRAGCALPVVNAGGGGGCAPTKVPGARALKQRPERCVRARAATARSNFLPRKLISARDGTIRSELFAVEVHIGVLTHYTSGVRKRRLCQE